MTDSLGNYLFNFLLLGGYEVEAEAANSRNLHGIPVSLNVAQPNVTFGTGTFGRITAVSNSPRQMQMALKLYF